MGPVVMAFALVSAKGTNDPEKTAGADEQATTTFVHLTYRSLKV